ncbi:MAG: M20 family metallopeptidase [Woeseiaceae bacterium]|nr:M20 family metallopeptidase [Woeseiaceae bacterium]
MVAEYATAIADHVRKHRQELTEMLRHMVDAESPSSQPESHRLMISILNDAFSTLGYKVSNPAPNGSYRHVFARRRERAKNGDAQLLLGHFDTVWPLGTVAKRPFTIDGNIIRGPGVFDMKGGLAQIVFALKAIHDLQLPLSVEPVVFINSDEEIGSRTSRRYVCALAKRAQRVFVMEPSMGEEGAIKTERKGIGRFTVTVHGKAAHAGLDPEGGASAILELSHVIQSLFAMNDVEKGITVNVGTIDGGLQPNVIAPHSQAVVDVRVPTIADGERIEKDILGLRPVTPGVRLSIEGRIGRPAMEMTPRNRTLWNQARELGQELGIDLQHGRAGGGSDGNLTSQYTATLDGLGPVGHGAHAEHEFLYVDRTLDRTALLALLLLSPVSSEAPA